MREEHDSFNELLVQIEKHFNCKLEDVVLRDYTLSLDYLCSRVNHIDPSDESFLRDIFVKDNVFWQKTMLTYYNSSYPLVCDVFTNLASRLLFSLSSVRFEVFTAEGTFGAEGAYHQWVLAMSKKTKVGYYIDSTYIQFLPGVKTSHLIVGPDGRRVEMQDFSGLRFNVANGLSMSKFPVSVIRVGSGMSKQWHPNNFIALLHKRKSVVP